jgi:hypothetical protein
MMSNIFAPLNRSFSCSHLLFSTSYAPHVNWPIKLHAMPIHWESVKPKYTSKLLLNVLLLPPPLHLEQKMATSQNILPLINEAVHDYNRTNASGTIHSVRGYSLCFFFFCLSSICPVLFFLKNTNSTCLIRV